MIRGNRSSGAILIINPDPERLYLLALKLLVQIQVWENSKGQSVILAQKGNTCHFDTCC